MDQKTLKNLCYLFLHFMLYTKKISEHTLKAYKTDLQEFFAFKDNDEIYKLNKKNFNVKIKDKSHLEKSIKFLIEKNTSKHLRLANSSRSRKLATIRSFIKWLAEQDYIEEDFRHLFKSPKVFARIPSFLSVDEIFSILEVFKKEKEKIHTKREQALFFLLYGGGLRVSEACQLKTKDISWSRLAIKIRGKGGKERLVSLPKKAFEHIRNLESEQEYLFGAKPLPQRKAYDIIKSIGRRAGLLKPLHPHALRHSFATHMLLGGSDLRVLQELLGHRTLTATQKYTHLDLAHLSNTLEKYHPLNQQKELTDFKDSDEI